MKINTTPGETYIVLSTGGCTVTTGAGKQIKKLAAGQDFFTAMTGDSIISDDNASVTVAKGEILAMLNTDGTGAEVQATLRFQPVTSQSALPAIGENGVIYLVPNGADAPNQYTEWVWTGAAYEQLGDVSVDLSGYASKADLGITTIDPTDSGPLIVSNAMLSTKLVQVSGLWIGACSFSGSTDGEQVVNIDGSLSAYSFDATKLGGYDVITTGGSVITNRIKVVSDTPTLLDSGILTGAEISGYNFTDEGGYLQHGIGINAGGVSLTNMFGDYPYLEAPVLRTTQIVSLAGADGEFLVGNRMRVGRDFVSLGGEGSWDTKGIKYTHFEAGHRSNIDILEVGYSSMISLGTEGELRCGDDNEGIHIYTNGSGIATLRIGSQANVIGLSDFGGGGADISAQAVTTESLYTNTIYANDTDELVSIYASVTGVRSLGASYNITARCFRVQNKSNTGDAIRLGFDSVYELGTGVPVLYLGESARITGPGWDTMVQQIQAGSSGSTGSGSGSTGDSNRMDTLYVNTIYPTDTTDLLTIEAYVTGVHSLGVKDDLYVGKKITTNACYTNAIYASSSDGELIVEAHVTGVTALGVKNFIDIDSGNIRIGKSPNGSETDGLYLGTGMQITGPGWDTMVQQIQAGSSSGSGGGNISTLTLGELNVNTIKFTKSVGSFAGGGISFEGSDLTQIASLGAEGIYTRNIQVSNNWPRKLTIGTPEGEDTSVLALYLGEGVHIVGPGWEEMQAAAAATVAEPEQPSFTKLIFPPTGTATAEQDPSWITKSHILMETNGGQLNMTHLTATLAYASQTPLAIAKRTLWLSTSSGSGDAVQWPANAVFPDDQPQDKIQQLNSNSTYWFDITYVGGSDTVLIRKVCSWASTTGESGPTE